MQLFIYNLFDGLLSGNGCQMIYHPEMTLTGSQHTENWSLDNIELRFERGLHRIVRPLEKNIILIGTVGTEERVASYAMPYDIESESGVEWNRSGSDNAWAMRTVVRLSMIVKDKVADEADAELRFFSAFCKESIRDAWFNGRRTWESTPAHLEGFTSNYPLITNNIMGFEQEDLLGEWFGAIFNMLYVPSEHVAIRKL